METHSLLEEQWRSLPRVYHIMDLPKAQGLVFLTQCSAQRWLIENGLPTTSFVVSPCTILYCPSATTGKRFRTTEEIVAERNKVLDGKLEG